MHRSSNSTRERTTELLLTFRALIMSSLKTFKSLLGGVQHCNLPTVLSAQHCSLPGETIPLPCVLFWELSQHPQPTWGGASGGGGKPCCTSGSLVRWILQTCSCHPRQCLLCCPIMWGNRNLRLHHVVHCLIHLYTLAVGICVYREYTYRYYTWRQGKQVELDTQGTDFICNSEFGGTSSLSLLSNLVCLRELIV